MEKWLNRPGSYNCVYALPAGTLSRDLIACLGHSHSKGAGRFPICREFTCAHPKSRNDRQLPGHWEGDLINEAANASAIGTLVEHSRRLLVVKLPPIRSPAVPRQTGIAM